MLSKEEWFAKAMSDQRINLIFDQISSIKFEKQLYFSNDVIKGIEYSYTGREQDLAVQKLDLQPFYILDHISENTKSVIYDIGCGGNFFKKFYNIVGIDPISPSADITDYFDNDFAKNHTEKFDNVFSINAIHFCNVTELRDRVLGFINLAKKGGYVYLAINSMRVLERSTNGTVDEIREAFKNIDEDVIYFEDLIDKYPDEWLNGNIRILMKRK